VAAGDSEALRDLIDKWKKPLINFFYRSLGSYAESEDLAQQVFIKLYRAAERYEARAKFSTFL
jgi:RNA polymerase sigma-70 factor (ECF subfamily)